jgi:hypothetical protein
MTIKGLEPEIQRLVASHKLELEQLQAAHDQQVAHMAAERDIEVQQAVLALRTVRPRLFLL